MPNQNITKIKKCLIYYYWLKTNIYINQFNVLTFNANLIFSTFSGSVESSASVKSIKQDIRCTDLFPLLYKFEQKSRTLSSRTPFSEYNNNLFQKQMLIN